MTDWCQAQLPMLREADLARWMRARGARIVEARGRYWNEVVPGFSFPGRGPEFQSCGTFSRVDVNLVRINPQGAHMDPPTPKGNAKSDESHVGPVLKQIRKARKNGHGVIGMKIIGNGDFTNAEDREKSIRFAMQCGLLDAAVIGFKSPAEIDEAIERVNRALAEAPAAQKAQVVGT